MPHFPIVTPDEASDEVKGVYEEFHRRMSFPSAPNFIMTQGHSSTVARGTWELVRNVLVSGKVPRWTKEMMFVAISKDRQCRYCTAAHLACCRMLGVTPAALVALENNINNLSDPKLRDTIAFAVKCSRNPQSLTEQDYGRLRNHGLNESAYGDCCHVSARGLREHNGGRHCDGIGRDVCDNSTGVIQVLAK